MNNKFDIQENQYQEPYHHFVSMDGNIYKMLDWGLGYYSYISRVMYYIDKYNDKLNNGFTDVGCGDGKLLLELSKKYKEYSFSGFDLSDRAINFAKAYSYGVSNLEFNARDFSESNKTDFGIITCIEILEHIADEAIPPFLDVLRNKINKDGILIITVPTIVVPINKKHYRHYDEDVLLNQLAGKFKVIRFEWIHNDKNSKWLRLMLVNRFYILRYEPFRKLLIKLYNKFYQLSNSKKGEHLLAICEPI